MSAAPAGRPPARAAGPELEVLSHWEVFASWLLEHTNRWPRSARFTLAQRLQDHALDVAEALVVARYEPAERLAALRRTNLVLERMRLLLRLARRIGLGSDRSFERAAVGLDATGRMVHGWRKALGERGRA